MPSTALPSTARILEFLGPTVRISVTWELCTSRDLDIDLLLRTVEAVPVGRVHLVGPDCLTEGARSRLTSHARITLHGSVPAPEVPSWLVAFDVLICPHVVTEFTLSLDAIKAYEYLATSRAVVATPTSGFQEQSEPGLYVSKDDFPHVVRDAAAGRTASGATCRIGTIVLASSPPRSSGQM